MGRKECVCVMTVVCRVHYVQYPRLRIVHHVSPCIADRAHLVAAVSSTAVENNSEMHFVSENMVRPFYYHCPG